MDVTCYRGLTTFPDEVIRKVNSLSPSEISQNFTRLYIYNMNSVYRKCSRRTLRLVAKDAKNILNPTTLEYHLLGSLQELQAHFHLGPLQLPKDTSEPDIAIPFSFHIGSGRLTWCSLSSDGLQICFPARYEIVKNQGADRGDC